MAVPVKKTEKSSPPPARFGAAAPSPWVCRFAPMIAAGMPVLDVAAGNGRHARYFLERGHPVVALDRDLGKLEPLGRMAGAELIAADLEAGAGWPLGQRLFGGIVVTNYLHRPLFDDLAAALAAGGVLIYETFAAGNEAFGKPRNPDFLLRPGELLAAFGQHLRIVAFEDGVVDDPRPAVVQRLCAVNWPPAGAFAAPAPRLPPPR